MGTGLTSVGVRELRVRNAATSDPSAGIGLVSTATGKLETWGDAEGVALPRSADAQQLSACAWLTMVAPVESSPSDRCMGQSSLAQQDHRASAVLCQPAHWAQPLDASASTKRTKAERLISDSTALACWRSPTESTNEPNRRGSDRELTAQRLPRASRYRRVDGARAPVLPVP